jgi:hypothetical protein
MRLLRTAARTAVVAGTATRVHQRVAARQHGRWAEQTAAAPPHVPAATAPARDTSAMIADLTELGRLRDAGVLTEAEFDVQKALVLRA